MKRWIGGALVGIALTLAACAPDTPPDEAETIVWPTQEAPAHPTATVTARSKAPVVPARPTVDWEEVLTNELDVCGKGLSAATIRAVCHTSIGLAVLLVTDEGAVEVAYETCLRTELGSRADKILGDISNQQAIPTAETITTLYRAADACYAPVAPRPEGSS